MSDFLHNLREFLYFLRDQHPVAMKVWFFGFGACVGSFLNVCILRIPAGRSIVTPRSTCVCGKPIAWYDNLPILSWYLLGGKARCCGAKFSMRYTILETVTAGAYLWLWMVFAPHMMTYAFGGMIFFALLLLGAMIDLDHMVLPDISTIGGMFIGVVLSCIWPIMQNVAPSGEPWIIQAVHAGTLSAIGAIVGSGVVFWIRELGEIVFKKEAMGYGDILLMGCIGAFCGWQGALFAIFGGAVLGLIVVLPWMAFAWAFRKPGTEPATPTAPVPAAVAAAKAGDETTPDGHPTPGIGVEIPFGPWLALAGFLYYAWPFLHNGISRYFDILTSLAMGEMPKQ